jgi:hypothetical protein
MKLTLNFEALAGFATLDIAAKLHTFFASPVSRVRVQDTSYQGPDGPVHARVFVAEVSTPLNEEAIVQACYVLSEDLGQDCIAASVDGVGTLIGPRAERWLPFNPEHFVGY